MVTVKEKLEKREEELHRGRGRAEEGDAGMATRGMYVYQGLKGKRT